MRTISGLDSRAAVVVERVGGRNRCTTLRSDPPLTFRMAGRSLFLVGTTAGPVGGDRLQLDVSVCRGARLHLRSAAASLVLPGPGGAPSWMSTKVTVGSGGEFSWAPEPTVLVQGCDHRLSVDVHLEEGATLMWRDEVVLGRHDEPAGSLLHRLRIDVAGAPLLRTELQVGPRWPGSGGPAGLGEAGAVGSLVLVSTGAGRVPEPLPRQPGTRAAMLPLGDGALVVSALGRGSGGVGAVLAAAQRSAASGASARRGRAPRLP